MAILTGFARRNAVKAGSNLPKTTGMPNKWTIISFIKSHERLLHFVRKIHILIMLKGTRPIPKNRLCSCQYKKQSDRTHIERNGGRAVNSLN